MNKRHKKNWMRTVLAMLQVVCVATWLAESEEHRLISALILMISGWVIGDYAWCRTFGYIQAVGEARLRLEQARFQRAATSLRRAVAEHNEWVAQERAADCERGEP